MASTSDKVLQLRQLLAKSFVSSDLNAKRTYVTGLPALDQAELPQAAITEIVINPSNGPGGALLVYGLLHSTLQKGDRVALIDANDTFQPKGLPASDLFHLLWMRCKDAGRAIKATDLVVRDGNLPLVILLLVLSPPSELRRIPSTAWHRLQMLAEQSAVTLLVVTPAAQVGCAQLRLRVEGAFPLQKLHHLRDELIPTLDLKVERRRSGREGRFFDEELRRSVCA